MAAAGCGGSKPPPVGTGPTTTAGAAARPRPTKPLSGPTKLVDEWAVCERRHGDAHQADPTIDAHGVIHVTTPLETGGRLVLRGGPETASGTCGGYLARAQHELRVAHPVRDPQGPDQAEYLRYVQCMRSNGVPNYPYPEANDPTKTDFIGTGVNPNSPAVLRVNDLCGNKLGLPAWWVKGWGQPGDISVRSAGVSGEPPACVFRKKPCSTEMQTAPGL